MARVGIGGIEYAVAQRVKDAAPIGYCYRHFAWFRRDTGRCALEWAGYVEAPDLAMLDGADRVLGLKAWQAHVIQRLRDDYRIDWWVSPYYDPGNDAIFYACVDVTRFAWPVGDHRWHRWADIEREIVWPEWKHTIELRIDEPGIDVMPIVAGVSSSRPVRDAVPLQRVLMVSGTPLEHLHNVLVGGRFVRRGDRWGLEIRDEQARLLSSQRAMKELPAAAIEWVLDGVGDHGEAAEARSALPAVTA